jgi:hypothetical protein
MVASMGGIAKNANKNKTHGDFRPVGTRWYRYRHSPGAPERRKIALGDASPR